MRLTASCIVAIAAILTLSIGCSDYKSTGGAATAAEVRDSRNAEAQRAIQEFLRHDRSLERFFETSYGYVVFPSVGKGGAGIGGAHDDDGVVFRNGQPVGDATLTQASIGLQLGGQVYREIIFFADEYTFNRFTQGNLEFSAQASAVAAADGAGAKADYEEGVAVFTLPVRGLMGEAAVGGQKFSFTPR